MFRPVSDIRSVALSVRFGAGREPDWTTALGAKLPLSVKIEHDRRLRKAQLALE